MAFSSNFISVSFLLKANKQDKVKPNQSNKISPERSPCQTRSQRIHTGEVQKNMNWQSENAKNLNSPGAKEQN